MQVVGRRNPKIDLGPVDCSVAMLLCDLELPDSPIVYATDSFCTMTGYTQPEVLGRNCRFLQRQLGKRRSGKAADKLAVRRMRQAVRTHEEVQVSVENYKKSGQRFTNILTIIPLKLGSENHHYAVGFSVEWD